MPKIVNRNAESKARLSPYPLSSDYPPESEWRTDASLARWAKDVFEKNLSDHDIAQITDAEGKHYSERERFLITRTAAEYITLRKEGKCTCEEYCRVLVKRARLMRKFNQWIFSNYELFDKLIEDAKKLDNLVEDADNCSLIAPLYGLPIPIKGSAAVVDYPNGVGFGVLSGYAPVKDAMLVSLIREKNGLIFGCTNLPEFASAYTAGNKASGFTRNPYTLAASGDKCFPLNVGGSSGGAASVVASYMCPLSISEDTGGSTRSPASCCQNFAFDPSRNHYPNEGNPGLSMVCDQLGVHARSVEDIIAFDRAVMDTGAFYDEAERAARKRLESGNSIRIGAPLHPYVESIIPSDLWDVGPWAHPKEDDGHFTLDRTMKSKYDRVKAALDTEKAAAGSDLPEIKVLQKEWPSKYFDYLKREENVIVESVFSSRIVNGERLNVYKMQPFFQTAGGQLAQFVESYLEAPVGLSELLDDAGACTLAPAFARGKGTRGANGKDGYCETQFRYQLGPKTKNDLDAYNSYFDTHDVDCILVPCGRCPTTNLSDALGNTMPMPKLFFQNSDAAKEKRSGELRTVKGDLSDNYSLHLVTFKHLHIPKLVVPTGLCPEGRPTAVQLWGRALSYDDMFEDSAALKQDAEFLQLMKKVVPVIAKRDPSLARVDAPVLNRLWRGL